MVVIIPETIPKFSRMTFATGARQLVVQEAFEIIWWAAGSYIPWLTPMTMVMSGFVAGADINTFLAPPVKCFEAPSRSRKIPVHSHTISTLASFHGICPGSLRAVTFVTLLSTVMESAVEVTFLLNKP